EIFARLLGKSYDAYISSKYVLQVLYAMRRYIERYGRILPRHPRDRYSEAELVEMGTKVEKISAVEKKREENVRVLNSSVPAAAIVDKDGDILPEYQSKLVKYQGMNNAFGDELHRLINTYERKKEDDGAAVKRVQENLKSGRCDICKFPVGRGSKNSDGDGESSSSEASSDSDSSDSDSSDSDDSDDFAADDAGIFIPKCCGIIVCEICFKGSFKIHQYHDYKTNADMLMGKCAACPDRKLNIKTDIIYINPEFNMNSIMTGFGTEKAPDVEEVVEEKVENVSDIPEIDNPKLKAIWSIYHGKKAENCQVIKEKMFYYPATEDHPDRWMIDPGTYDAPVPEGTPIKILCFAPFTETLRMIMDFCEKHKMNYVNLKGTDMQINNIINNIQSTDRPAILLVNSEV